MWHFIFEAERDANQIPVRLVFFCSGIIWLRLCEGECEP